MDAQDLHKDGIKFLAIKVIRDCVAAGSLEQSLATDIPTPLDVALDWAVWCGEDPYVAAQGLIRHAQHAQKEKALQQLEYHREYQRLMRYSKGNCCPECGTPITNSARTCKLHRGIK